MKILFYLGHPAHFHLFKNLFKVLEKNSDKIFITIKTKDLLEDLLIESNYPYENIYPSIRKQNKLSIIGALFIKNARLFKIALNFKPDLMLGTSIEIAEVGRFIGIPTAIVNEDDFDVVPQFAKLGYPFTNHIIAPKCCRLGRWYSKGISYNGYHELAYLSSKYFKPNKNILNKYDLKHNRYFVMRFSKLKAYHDEKISGITKEIAIQLIDKLNSFGTVFLSSESELDSEFDKYRLSIDPRDIHELLAFADLYIGDSQTMAAEAAVLGTPSLRYNDFVRRISYLDELEDVHHLTFGFKTREPEKLLQKLDELLKIPDLKKQWKIRAQQLMKVKIDLTLLLFWFIQYYPESGELIAERNGVYSEAMLSKNFVEDYSKLMDVN